MAFSLSEGFTKDGDLVQLVGLSHKSFILTLHAGAEFHTHRGLLKHDDLIGKQWGSQVFSHNGSPFFILQPTLSDVLKNTKRFTQIMYPKEIAYTLLYMGIGPGSRVIEAGTGSGSFTTALAHAVGDEGHIFTYEVKESTQNAARKTLESLGFSNRVDFIVRDIKEGFDQNNVDAVFLDVSNPFDYLEQVRASVKPGGFFGCIVPTTNQVIQVLVELRRKDFAFIEVCDVSVRFYKTEPTRFRPTDRMISHTGYLVFARKVDIDRQMSDKKLLQEIGLLNLAEIKNEGVNEDGNELFEE